MPVVKNSGSATSSAPSVRRLAAQGLALGEVGLHVASCTSSCTAATRTRQCYFGGRVNLAVSVHYRAGRRRSSSSRSTARRSPTRSTARPPTRSPTRSARFDADDDARGRGAHRRERDVLRRRRPEGDARAGTPRAQPRASPTATVRSGPTRMLLAQAGDRRGRGPRGRRRARARGVVRPARRGRGRGVRRLLPALGHPADGRRHDPPRAADRPQPRARPDPHRPRRVGRGGAADGARQPPRAARARRCAAAIALAHEIASRPQAALRSDRLSSYEQWCSRSPTRSPTSTATGWRRSRPASCSAGSTATRPATGELSPAAGRG